MTAQELYTYNFYLWELRGRGWLYHSVPVVLEPPFKPFSHLDIFPDEEQPYVDDGRVKLLPFRLWDSVKDSFKKNEAIPIRTEEPEEPIYESIPVSPSTGLVELQITVPQGDESTMHHMHELLLMLTVCQYPLSFEIIGTGDEITIQLVCDTKDEALATGYIYTFLPDAIVHRKLGYFESLGFGMQYTTIAHLGLSQEFVRPLNTDFRYTVEPLTGVFSTLEHLRKGECAIVQIMFQGTSNPWSSSIMHSVSDFEGGCFFVDDPQMLVMAKEKVSSPLFAVTVRLGADSSSYERNNEILEGLYRGISSSTRYGSNALSAINHNVSFEDLLNDVLDRTTHLSGMILNSNELVNLVHLPISSVPSSKLQKQVRKTKPLQKEHVGDEYSLGINEHYGTAQSISLSHQERLRHIHVIGATGSGKSNLIKHLIIQDFERGNACCVLDPHGDLIEDVIRYIPEDRIKDVILIDPSDFDHPIGLNLLQAHSEVEKIVLESDLVSVFRRESTSWGDQMTSVFSNAINAFLESSQGGSLVDLRKFLVDKTFRNEFLKTVKDDQTLQFWHREFQLLRSNSVSSILTRLDTFLRPKIIRNMMIQKSGIDFGEIINSNKILLVKLSQGLIGEQNSHLLGALFIAKLNQASQARQQLSSSSRTPFYLYIDEFQNFITESMLSILSGARKYGLGLILAHQDMEQINTKERELANSILSNPYTRICFRCGDNDARKLESAFASFGATDIQNLQVGDAIVRIGARDHDGNISVPLVEDVEHARSSRIRELVVENTRSHFPYKQPPSHTQTETIEPDTEESIQEEQEVIEVVAPISTSPPPQELSEDKAEKIVKRYERKQEEREHLLIQAYVKKVAEERGFKATIEEPTPDDGRVDIGLSMGNLKLACEVSVTNTSDYEVQNIEKCLRAGFDRVFMISEDVQHLKNIRVKSVEVLKSNELQKVFFIRKEALIESLDEIVAQMQKPKQKVHRGYKVNVSMDQDDASSDKRQSLNDLIISSMKKQGK